ncbi:MAG: hypothetical protein K0R08_387 [Solimicrobium sp.]|nr:hypothetical protein [Solimicrobium sp.]
MENIQSANPQSQTIGITSPTKGEESKSKLTLIPNLDKDRNKPEEYDTEESSASLGDTEVKEAETKNSGIAPQCHISLDSIVRGLLGPKEEIDLAKRGANHCNEGPKYYLKSWADSISESTKQQRRVLTLEPENSFGEWVVEKVAYHNTIIAKKESQLNTVYQNIANTLCVAHKAPLYQGNSIIISDSLDEPLGKLLTVTPVGYFAIELKFGDDTAVMNMTIAALKDKLISYVSNESLERQGEILPNSLCRDNPGHQRRKKLLDQSLSYQQKTSELQSEKQQPRENIETLELVKELEKKTSEIQLFQGQLKEANTKLNNAEEKVNELVQRQQELVEQNDKLKAQLKKAQKAAEELAQQYRQLEEKNKELTEQKEKLTNLNISFQEKQQEYAVANKKVKQLEQEKHQLELKINELVKQSEQQQVQQQRISQLEKQVDELTLEKQQRAGREDLQQKQPVEQQSENKAQESSPHQENEQSPIHEEQPLNSEGDQQLTQQ